MTGAAWSDAARGACCDATRTSADRIARPNLPDRVHGGALRAICDLLAELGIAADDLLDRAGLPRTPAERADIISYAALGRLTALSAERTRCPHFGLMVGQRTTLASFGLLGVLMRNSATVGDALRALEAHHGLLNRGAVVSLSTNEALAMIAYAPYEPDIDGIGLHCERAVAAITQILRALCDADWRPDEVLLPRTQPADRQPYASFFQAPVRFDQEVAALVFPARLLGRPVRDVNPLVHRIVERRIRQIEASNPPDLTEDLRRRLRVTMAEQQLSAEQVARTMAIHRRTLSRRLRAEGTSFRMVASETRLGVAKHLLIDTDLSLAQISATLDFSEPSAFTHAFRRWTGTAPSAWRRAQRLSTADRVASAPDDRPARACAPPGVPSNQASVARRL